MAFFAQPEQGYAWAAGHFLVNDEGCVRKSAMIAANHAQVETRGDRKVVPAGAVIPSNDGNAVGILYEDIDVTNGAAFGSIVTDGIVYEDRLPASIQSAAKTAMTGIKVIASSPAVTRPDWFNREFTALTVQSAAGTASGDTAVTVSGYSLGSGEAFKYQIGDKPAAVALGSTPSGTWNTYTAGTDITAASGKTITVVALSAGGYVVAAGSATVTAKA